MRILVVGLLLLLTTGQGINFFSPEQDVEIGLEASKEAERSLQLIREANLNRYVQAVGQRITHNPLVAGIHYKFHIVNSREINSLGFPGGSVYVNRALVEVADNQDELAAILAHEVGHIAARHGTSQLSRQLLVQSPISIAAGLPAIEAWKEQLTKLGISFGADAAFLRYSRDQELEANLIAVRLLADTRLDAHALNTFREKIYETPAAEGTRLPAFVFNHPQSDSLSSQIAEEVDRLSSPGPRRAHTSAEFRAFRSALLKLAYPATDKEPEIAPSDAMSSVFVHPQDYYRLGYPAGWQVVSAARNGGIIAPMDGMVGSDITRGILFDLFDISVPERALTLEQATNRLIVFLRQRNQSLRIIPGAQVQTLVSDEPGLRTVMIGRSNTTDSSEVVWVVTRLYYQSLFYMVFVAPEDEFPTYQPIFEQVVRSARLR